MKKKKIESVETKEQARLRHQAMALGLMRKPQRKGFGDAKLGKVVEMDPKQLFMHPSNCKFFGDGSSENYEFLKADIESRGVQSAIAAIRIKGRLYILSGNRRVEIALKLGLKNVPVRIAKANMSLAEQEYFIVVDNISVRDMVKTKKLDLLKMVFPDLVRQIQREYVERKNGRAVRRHDSVTDKHVSHVMRVGENEAKILKNALKTSIVKEIAAEDFSLGDGVDQKTISHFETQVQTVIMRHLPGSNEATLFVAKRFLEKRSKDLFGSLRGKTRTRALK